ncbi:MAG TPA: RICIN domain-containing protein [Pseudonocardiaceae bacterium]|jgi:hypothetical protein|nr:RICIN domain-containing protein [Pseudonocardiaceae bacterium]
MKFMSARRAIGAAAVAAGVVGLVVTGMGSANAQSAFTVHLTPNNTFGLLLDVEGGSLDNGAPVITYWANGGSNQQWTFLPIDNAGDYYIKNVNSGKCLTTDEVPGHNVYQFTCANAPQQVWSTALNPNLWDTPYTITNPQSGLKLDVSGDNALPGAYIDTWYYNGGANQFFAPI